MAAKKPELEMSHDASVQPLPKSVTPPIVRYVGTTYITGIPMRDLWQADIDELIPALHVTTSEAAIQLLRESGIYR